jgi:lipoyl(octanoyl) transferase
MLVEDLGILSYRPAWQRQEAVHAEVADGGDERILLAEHPPVITFGRRSGVERHLLASDAQLRQLGVEVVQSDRGGDITFHGPGQVVAYPIVRLNDHRLSIGGYVKRLEEAVVMTLAEFGISARPRECGAVGVWVEMPDGPAKICALGVRIRRGVSMHGLALNVTTDLRYFNMIVPCGLSGRRVTSMQELLGDNYPPAAEVKQVLCDRLMESLQPRNEPAAVCAGREERG